MLEAYEPVVLLEEGLEARGPELAQDAEAHVLGELGGGDGDLAIVGSRGLDLEQRVEGEAVARGVGDELLHPRARAEDVRERLEALAELLLHMHRRMDHGGLVVGGDAGERRDRRLARVDARLVHRGEAHRRRRRRVVGPARIDGLHLVEHYGGRIIYGQVLLDNRAPELAEVDEVTGADAPFAPLVEEGRDVRPIVRVEEGVALDVTRL